jgi:hypothetical protein
MKAWVVGCCCWVVLGMPSVGWASASGTVQHVVQWILSTGDHQGLPFVVVDKTQAQPTCKLSTHSRLARAGQADTGDQGRGGGQEGNLSSAKLP